MRLRFNSGAMARELGWGQKRLEKAFQDLNTKPRSKRRRAEMLKMAKTGHRSQQQLNALARLALRHCEVVTEG